VNELYARYGDRPAQQTKRDVALGGETQLEGEGFGESAGMSADRGWEGPGRAAQADERAAAARVDGAGGGESSQGRRGRRGEEGGVSDADACGASTPGEATAAQRSSADAREGGGSVGGGGSTGRTPGTQRSERAGPAPPFATLQASPPRTISGSPAAWRALGGDGGGGEAAGMHGDGEGPRPSAGVDFCQLAVHLEGEKQMRRATSLGLARYVLGKREGGRGDEGVYEISAHVRIFFIFLGGG
jgi:hypothetical protein